jgi:hypothetical protein
MKKLCPFTMTESTKTCSVQLSGITPLTIPIHWNGEDLSIVTSDHSGAVSGRAIDGWLRPYPVATAGIPIQFTWHRKKALFCLHFIADAKIKAPTEIFLPTRWFGKNPDISVGTAGIRTEYSAEEQRLLVFNDGYDGEVLLEIKGKPKL